MEKQPYNKLKAFFIENGIKHKDVAYYLGITEQTFSAKINKNGQDFTLSQVRKICSKYKLDPNIVFLNI